MKKIIHKILLALFGIIAAINTYAYDYNSSSNAWTQPSYSFCYNEIQTDIWFYADETDDDYIERLVLEYYDGNTWVPIYEMGDGTGRTNDWVTNSDDFGWDSKNGAVISHSVIQISDYYYCRIKWQNIPTALLGTTITMRISNLDVYVDNQISLADDIKSVATTNPKAITGLTTTAGTKCSQVDLKWTNPTTTVCSVGGTWKAEIYKDDVLYTTKAIPTFTTHTDFFDDNGVEHIYKIRTLYTAPSGEKNYSDFTPNISGYVTAVPGVPTAIASTDNNCNSEIVVTWQWSSADPLYFILQRATNATFTTGLVTVTSTISGSTRSFTTTPPANNFTYYYRLSAMSVCGDFGAWSVGDAGFSPHEPNAPSTVLLTNVAGNIKVDWTDNSSDETGFIVQRSIYGGGGVSTYNVPANTTTYTDNSNSNCVKYVYIVKAKNGCNTAGVESLESTSFYVSADLSTTFDATKKLNVSKGYYPNYVQLTWSNNNLGKIDNFQIYRKVYGTATEILIASVSGTTGTYNDVTADAGVLYEYKIIGESNCAGNTVTTNSSIDRGFKSPTAIISGHVEYEGGIAVKNANVYVSKVSGSSGNCVSFDGLDDYINVPQSSSLNNISTAFTIEVWLRPNMLQITNYFLSKGSALSIYLNNGDLNVQAGVSTFTSTKTFFTDTTWSHLAVTYDLSKIRLYRNGALLLDFGQKLNKQNNNFIAQQFVKQKFCLKKKF